MANRISVGANTQRTDPATGGARLDRSIEQHTSGKGTNFQAVATAPTGACPEWVSIKSALSGTSSSAPKVGPKTWMQ
jgi:hypothetical protein